MPKRDLSDLEELVRVHEQMETELADLTADVVAGREYLLEQFQEAGFAPGAGAAISTKAANGDELRAKVQDSFTAERWPDAPQAALDAVFRRIAHPYVKIERVVAHKGKVRKR